MPKVNLVQVYSNIPPRMIIMLSEIAMAFIVEKPLDFTRNNKTTRLYYLCFILYSINVLHSVSKAETGRRCFGPVLLQGGRLHGHHKKLQQTGVIYPDNSLINSINHQLS